MGEKTGVTGTLAISFTISEARPEMANWLRPPVLAFPARLILHEVVVEAARIGAQPVSFGLRRHDYLNYES
jgi:hypothetical protein